MDATQVAARGRQTSTESFRPAGSIAPGAAGTPPSAHRNDQARGAGMVVELPTFDVTPPRFSFRITHLPDATHASPRPRTSLCTRVTRWMTVAMMGVAIWGALGRSDGKSPPTTNRQDLAMREGPHPSEATASATPFHRPTSNTDLPAIESPAALRARLVDLYRLHAETETRVLTTGINAVFTLPNAGMDDYLRALGALLAPPSGQATLSLEQVDRRVDAFRASGVWRETLPTSLFMATMTEMLGGPDTPQESLAHLLRVWSHRIEELPASPVREGLELSRTLSVSVAKATARLLGGASISDSHLRTLVGVVCQEPEDLQAGQVSTVDLDRAGQRVANAIVYLTEVITPESTSAGSRGRLFEANLRRCLQLARENTFREPRWLGAILQGLPVQENVVEMNAWLPSGRLAVIAREEMALLAPAGL